jgi:hypothetical protein
MSDTLGPEYYSLPDSGLIAYYRFDELEDLGVGNDGLANDVRDLTYNANHGKLMGGATLRDVNSNITNTKVELNDDIKPVDFTLYQNFPNSFNPSTNIRFSVPRSGLVSLVIFDTLGKEIGTLVNSFHETGSYNITWNAKNLPSGIYLARLQIKEYTKTIKLILEK